MVVKSVKGELKALDYENDSIKIQLSKKNDAAKIAQENGFELKNRKVTVTFDNV